MPRNAKSVTDLATAGQRKCRAAKKVVRRWYIPPFMLVSCLLLLVSCGRPESVAPGSAPANSSPSASSAAPTATAAATTVTVTMPAGADLFSPFIIAITPDTTVTWKNEDTDTYTVKTTPEQGIGINPVALDVRVAGNGTASYTFKTPGIYHYYDAAQASWDTGNGRVKANKGTGSYPLAMEGVIWVQGSIENAPSAITNDIPKKKDMFTHNFVVLRSGGTLTWRNFDGDEHVIAPVTGWSAPINPVNIGTVTLDGTESSQPSKEGMKTVTFSTPGLYYYYCPAHALMNTNQHRAIAMDDASEAPIPMEGFVLVVS